MRRVAFYQQLVAGLTEAGYTVIKAFLEHTPQEVLDDMAQVGGCAAVRTLHGPPLVLGSRCTVLLLAPVSAPTPRQCWLAHPGSPLCYL